MDGELFFYKNGWLIQGIDPLSPTIKNFTYKGLAGFYSYPLMDLADMDKECRKITDEHFYKEVEDGFYVILEFVSNENLLDRYLQLCKKHNVQYRLLYVESNYSNEICENANLENASFLGYEYCTIPIDEQIITDLDWCDDLHEYCKKLNSNGLFDTLEDVLDFKRKYEMLFEEGIIGDGAYDGYVFKVYEVKEK